MRASVNVWCDLWLVTRESRSGAIQDTRVSEGDLCHKDGIMS